MHFFTATIVNWKNVLSPFHKQIIVESLNYLVDSKRITLYGFVIMPNHLHVIWETSEHEKYSDIQRDFLRFTGQQILKDFRTNKPKLYKEFEVNLQDRKHQVWQRNAKTVALEYRKVVEQKLDYIHHNPVQGKWRLVDDYTDYHYSSASFYEKGEHSFPFLTHYMSYFGH